MIFVKAFFAHESPFAFREGFDSFTTREGNDSGKLLASNNLSHLQ